MLLLQLHLLTLFVFLFVSPHSPNSWHPKGCCGASAFGCRRIVADKWRTRTGGAAKANNTRWTEGGHMANTWRTHGGQAPGTRPEHIAASLFFLRENPTVNCLGNKVVYLKWIKDTWTSSVSNLHNTSATSSASSFASSFAWSSSPPFMPLPHALCAECCHWSLAVASVWAA